MTFDATTLTRATSAKRGASRTTARITIALCTHNRSDLFEQCLAALIPQLGPEFETFVIDSASVPEHAAKVASLAALYPQVTFIRLDEPGLSRARNAALHRATGDWFATIDDDAVAAADWAKTALELTAKVSREFAIIGGAVHPIFPDGATPQIGPRWQQLISAVELEGDYDQTEQPRVVAANLLFRRQSLLALGGFPENLGRVGKSLISGEDKLCVHQLLRQGFRIWYSAKLSVGHHVQAERLQRSWAKKRSYWDGRSDRRIEGMMGDRPPLGHTLKMLVKLAALTPLYFIPSQREYFLRFWYDFGWLQETILMLSVL